MFRESLLVLGNGFGVGGRDYVFYIIERRFMIFYMWFLGLFRFLDCFVFIVRIF